MLLLIVLLVFYLY